MSENTNLTEKNAEMIIDLQQISALFRVDDRTIQLWTTKGMPKNGRNSYDYVVCSQWLIDKLRVDKEIAEQSGDEKLHGLKMETQRIVNQQKRLQLQRMLGQLIDADEVRVAWTNEIKLFQKMIKGALAKIVVGIANLEDKKLQVEVIETHITEALSSLSEELKIDAGEDEEFIIEDVSDVE